MKKFKILIPLYNDWRSVSKLLNEIDSQTNNWNAEVSVIIVNDASTEEKPGLSLNYKKIKSVKILNMKENRVHQRCIAAGLKYICKNEDFDYVIIMDSIVKYRRRNFITFVGTTTLLCLCRYILNKFQKFFCGVSFTKSVKSQFM